MTRSGWPLGTGAALAAWAGVMTVGLGGTAALTLLAGVPPTAIALAAGAAAIVAGMLGIFARAKAGNVRVMAEKLSDEIDVLSRRLLQLEDRIRDQPPDQRPAVQEIAAEVGLLGRLVRDLAEAVSAQDGELSALRSEVRAAAAASPPPAREAPALVKAAPVPAADPVLATKPSLPVPDFEPAGVPAKRPARDPAPTPRVPDARDIERLVASRDHAEVDGAEARRVIAIREAFAADKIEVHLQPIVSLPQRKVRFYEALARLRLGDETLLAPAEFVGVLERCGLAPDLDRKVLMRAAAIARHLGAHGSETAVSVNLAPASLSAPGFLRGIARMAELYPDLSGRLILEIAQRSWRTLEAETAGALAQLRDAGLGFALDRATDLRLDPLSLAERGVRYAKLPAEMLLRAERTGQLEVAARDLPTILARAGIRLVAEKVEREEDVPDLLDLEIPLAQGFLFAAPRAVRPEALAGADDPALKPEIAPAPDSSKQPPIAENLPGSEERRPFRTFLRRAG